LIYKVNVGSFTITPAGSFISIWDSNEYTCAVKLLAFTEGFSQYFSAGGWVGFSGFGWGCGLGLSGLSGFGFGSGSGSGSGSICFVVLLLEYKQIQLMW
jgi:hypothetical protein